MLKIHELNIDSYEAYGIVYSDQLTDKQRLKLGVKDIDDQGFCEEVKVSIEYSIQWHDTIPMVSIESVGLIGPKNIVILNNTQYDYDELTMDLELKGPYHSWLEDKKSSYNESYDHYEE